ncbi:MAG TPA: polysaccharide pyruvyl transferase family protein [Nocardioidaceae bacterium]
MAGRRIYLVGSSGYPYYGDEAVAAAWLRHLAATEPDAEVYLDCPNPGGAQLFLADLHPHVRFVDTVFRISMAAPSEDPDEVVDFATQAFRQPGFGYAHRAAGVELLHTADVVHIIGGSYVNAIWPRHLGVYAAGQVLAEMGRHVAMTGQALLPSPTQGDALGRLTSAYAVVDLRDARSRALLSSDAATETGDDALLDRGEHVYDKRDSVSTMMCLQSDLVEGDLEALATSAVETAKAWGLRPERIGYVEAIPGQDRVLFEMIEGQLPGMRFYPFTEIWREGLPARRGQRWITTRAELHVAAAAAGAWGVAFPVRPGYDDVAHQDLVDRGSRWAIGTPGEAAPETHGDAGFGSAIEGLVEAKKAVAQRVYAR